MISGVSGRNGGRGYRETAIIPRAAEPDEAEGGANSVLGRASCNHRDNGCNEEKVKKDGVRDIPFKSWGNVLLIGPF